MKADDECASEGAEQVDIAREVADQLAIGIQQAHLHAQVQRHAADLEQRVAERTAGLQEINAEPESCSYSVSHDLRAPLRSIQGFAQIVLEEYDDRLDAGGQDYVQRIVAAAQRMDALTEDLLTYSRLSRATVELIPVSLEAVVAEALMQLDADIRGKEADVTVERPLPQVMGHYVTLVQGVANLVANGLKFVAPGLRHQVRIWAKERDGHVCLRLRDNGIDIAPEYQERIFRIFERLHGPEMYPGAGIGLSIVRKGVEHMGGQVGMESAPGQGSTFWLELRRPPRPHPPKCPQHLPEKSVDCAWELGYREAQRSHAAASGVRGSRRQPAEEGRRWARRWTQHCANGIAMICPTSCIPPPR